MHLNGTKSSLYIDEAQKKISSHGGFWLPRPQYLATKYEKVAKIGNRYSLVSHLTQDITWENDKYNKTLQTRAKKSVLSQQVATKQQ